MDIFRVVVARCVLGFSFYSKEMNLTACVRARERVLQNQKGKKKTTWSWCSECSVLLVRVRTLSAGHETKQKKKGGEKERKEQVDNDDDDDEEEEGKSTLFPITSKSMS